MSSESSFPQEDSSGPSINENWASPSELLEMRTMWSAIVTQHKAEVTALHAALERSHQQQQVYLKELQETHRLRHLYTQAAADQQKIVEERKLWAEERVLFEQEIQKLRLGGASSGSNGTSDTTTTTGWSGSTVGGGSSGAGSSSSSTNMLLSIAQEENVALHEALARHAREKSELEQRLQFVQTASSMQIRSLQLRVETQAGDLDRNQRKLREMSERCLRHERTIVSQKDTMDTLEARNAELEKTVEDQHDAMEREKVAADEELTVRLKALTARLTEGHQQQQKALETQLEDSNAAREGLRQTVERLVAARAKQAEESQTIAEGLAEAVQQLRTQLRSSEEDRLSISRAAQQMESDFADRFQHEMEIRQEMNTQRAALLMRLDGVESQLSLSEAENVRKATEIEHLQAQVMMLMNEISGLRDGASALTTAQATVAQLAEEIETLREFYEGQIVQHTKAMELLQRQHGEDKKTLLGMVVEKKEASANRSRSAKERRKTHGNATSDKENAKSSDKKKSCTSIDTSRDHSLAVDALQLMRMNANLAEKCALSIGKV